MPSSVSSSSTPKDHRHVNLIQGEKDQDASDQPRNLSQSSSSKKRRLDRAASESESDESPEVLSIVAGKRQLKEKEDKIDTFAQETARARRQANRRRDEKLKRNSTARKIKVPIGKESDSEEQLSSNAVIQENHPNSSNATIAQNTKKYLDPSLFASASRILEKSKKISQARELEKSKKLISRRRKHENLQNQNRRDVGNNTTVVLLSQTEQIIPAPRPISAANFERNRLYTKPSQSRVKLPKSTLAAKAEMGTRKVTVDSVHARRANKPAALFARS